MTNLIRMEFKINKVTSSRSDAQRVEKRDVNPTDTPNRFSNRGFV